MTWHDIGLAVEIGLAVFFGLALLVWAVLFVAQVWEDVREFLGGIVQVVWEFLTHNR